MITIEYDLIDSKVTSDNKRELREASDLLDKELSVKVDGAFFSPRFQIGMWDGVQRFYNTQSDKFKSGLLAKVVSTLMGADFEVSVVGHPVPTPGALDLERVELADSKQGYIVMDINDPVRDYQMQCVRQALHRYRGIFKLATNGGKTEVAAAILKVLNIPPTIFIVPSVDLLRQTADRLAERLQVPVGMLGGGKSKILEDGITVATFQTLSKHNTAKDKKWFQKVKVLFCDECHQVAAVSYRKCVQRIPADFRLGLSATPFEQKPLERFLVTGFLGPILSAVNNAKLMDKGVSVRPNVLLLEPQVTPREKLEFKCADYDDALTRCNSRNVLIASTARGLLQSGRQTIVFVNRIAHAKVLHDLIPESVVVTADDPMKYRRGVIKQLEQGEQIICITTLFTTGLSVDYIEGMIMASGGKSATLLLQKVGRTVRKARDVQKDIWIVDFLDSYNVHTRRHSRERVKIYEGQKAFNITQSIPDAPPELLQHIPVVCVNSKHLQKKLG